MKEYPERINDKKYPVCECSHFQFRHKINLVTHGECELCHCPKYKKETEMTFDENYDLQKTKQGGTSTMTKKLQVTIKISEKMNEVVEFDLPSHTKAVRQIYVIENNKPLQRVFVEALR